MLEIVEKENPDEIIHLGDCLRDAETVSFAFSDIPVTMVPGNCDGWTNRRDRLLLERDGVKLLLGHGHQWQVKSTSALALAEAGRWAQTCCSMDTPTGQSVSRRGAFCC